MRDIIGFLHTACARIVWGQEEDERGFSARLFWTVAAVYALFFNPYVQSSMTWNFLDLAASLVETGHPYLTHTGQYNAADTAWTPRGFASGEPLGPSLPLIPLAAILRGILGPDGARLEILNAVAVLCLSAPAGAAIAVLMYRRTRRLGRDEQWCRSVAWLGAFGTQAFPLSTMYTKELLGTLAGLLAFHLAARVRQQACDPSPTRLLGVGCLASLAGLTVYPLWILVPGLAWYMCPNLPRRRVVYLLLGAAPLALLFLAYNHATFGHPWLTGYFTLSDPRGGRWAWPSATILWDLLLGPAGGLLFYHPILALVPVGFYCAWRRPELRRDLGFTAGIGIALLLVYGAWLESHYDNNPFIAALGFRMLFPVVPLLVATLGALDGQWRTLAAWLGLPSLLFGIMFASAGLIPGRQLPLAYIAKVATSTLASGLFWGDALPRAMGIETLHTAITSHRIPTATLWGHADLPMLVARQLAFRLLSGILLLGAAAVLARVHFSGRAHQGATKTPA